jgi:hypothetical protein
VVGIGSALTVQNGEQMGTLVYTINGVAYYYNCTGNRQYMYYNDNLGGGRQFTASIKAVCTMQM